MTEVQMDRSTTDTVTSTGGVGIFIRSWQPEQTPTAILVIVHGFNSHSGRYGWAAGRFAQAGLAVYAPDLRGRGHSEGERFHVGSFADYVSDVRTAVALAESRHRGLPLFLLGHSAGGVIACSFALENPSRVAGLVCESFAYQVPAPDFALAALKGLSHITPHAHVLRLKNEDFSRDPSVVRAMNDDPLIAGESQSTQTVAEMVRAAERLTENFHRITLPLLIVHGTADQVTKPSGSQTFFDRAGAPDKTLKLYEGHAHDLLSDLGKEAVLAEMSKWIVDRASRASA